MPKVDDTAEREKREKDLNEKSVHVCVGNNEEKNPFAIPFFLTIYIPSESLSKLNKAKWFMPVNWQRLEILRDSLVSITRRKMGPNLIFTCLQPQISLSFLFCPKKP